METPSIRNDFRKAMGATILTAGAALSDAQRVVDKASAFRRAKTQTEVSLAAEFCRLLLEPVDHCGPGFSEIPGFPESYCRKYMSVATEFCRKAIAANDPSSPEAKRLAHIADLIHESLKRYLDERTAKLCWFGNRPPLIQEFQNYGKLG
jgi:hypothetical protein